MILVYAVLVVGCLVAVEHNSIPALIAAVLAFICIVWDSTRR